PINTEKDQENIPVPPPAESKTEEPREEDTFLQEDEYLIQAEEPAEEVEREAFVVESEQEPEPAEPVFKSREREPEKKGSKKTYWILGAAGLILIILFIIIWLWWMPAGPGKPVAETSEPEAETVVEESPQRKAIQRAYQNNATQNRRMVNQLEDIFNKKPASAEFSLIVMSPREMTITVLGESRSQVARFNMALKEAFPLLSLRMVDAQPKYQEDRPNQFYADIVVRLPESNPAGAASIDFGKTGENNPEATLRQMAKEQNLEMHAFRKGFRQIENEVNTTAVYANLQGNRENIFNFMNQLAKNYPYFRLNKLSIYPDNLGTIGKNKITARLNLEYFTES
ncbi:MAG: hypothetical protein WAN36_01100, partial [Calditrichia bacterium]